VPISTADKRDSLCLLPLVTRLFFPPVCTRFHCTQTFPRSSALFANASYPASCPSTSSPRPCCTPSTRWPTMRFWEPPGRLHSRPPGIPQPPLPLLVLLRLATLPPLLQSGPQTVEHRLSRPLRHAPLSVGASSRSNSSNNRHSVSSSQAPSRRHQLLSCPTCRHSRCRQPSPRASPLPLPYRPPLVRPAMLDRRVAVVPVLPYRCAKDGWETRAGARRA